MSPNQKLRDEAALTSQKLSEAATRLLNWAEVLGTSFFASAIPPEEIRQVAHALAHQGGRLSMAVDLAKPKKRH
jgi:hypothetical protein